MTSHGSARTHPGSRHSRQSFRLYLSGRVAQWESTVFTRRGSLVQSQPRPPFLSVTWLKISANIPWRSFSRGTRGQQTTPFVRFGGCDDVRYSLFGYFWEIRLKPLFTVHEGEFLVGDFIGRKFRDVDVWVPAKDRGIDLLVTDSNCKKAVSFQVKFSRDYLTTDRPAQFQKPLQACGWWTLNRSKIADSPAHYWVFALVAFGRRTSDFIVIEPSKLLARLDAIHGEAVKYQSYLWVTKDGRCCETRGLNRSDQEAIAAGEYSSRARDFSTFLNNWTPIEEL